MVCEIPARPDVWHTTDWHMLGFGPLVKVGETYPFPTDCGLSGAVNRGICPSGEPRPVCGNCRQSREITRCPQCQAFNCLVLDQSDPWADYTRCTMPGCGWVHRRGLGD